MSVLHRSAWLAVYFEEDDQTSFINVAKQKKLIKFLGAEDEVTVKFGPKWFPGKIVARGASEQG